MIVRADKQVKITEGAEYEGREAGMVGKKEDQNPERIVRRTLLDQYHARRVYLVLTGMTLLVSSVSVILFRSTEVGAIPPRVGVLIHSSTQ
jgi:hypothetical protein